MKGFCKALSIVLAIVMLASIFVTSVSAATLKQGSSGTQVKYLQMNLNSLGYSCGTADGKYGTKTYNAVKEFQKDNGLAVDGIAGNQTQAKIKSTITDLQQKLNDLGYGVGNVDGIAGSKTTAAIKKFQKNNNIKQTGIANKETLSALNEKHNSTNLCPIPEYEPTIEVPSYESSIKTEIVSVKYLSDEYSDWKALNEVYRAKRATETGGFEETYIVETTSSIDVTLDIKLIEAKIGGSIKTSVSTTIREGNSALLKTGEYCRYYYRDHWKLYQVIEKTTVMQFGKVIDTYTKTRTIKVAQELTADDYGWFYAYSEAALPDTLDSKWCDDNYTCKVK